MVCLKNTAPKSSTLCWIGIVILLISNSVFAIDISYDELGRLSQVKYDNGTSITYQYDALGNRTTQMAINNTDFDNDGIINSVDTDDDNDGLPDTVEQIAGLNPQDASDATGDLDNDGLSNLDEYTAGTAIDNADTDGDTYADGLDEAPLDGNVWDLTAPVLTLNGSPAVTIEVGEDYVDAGATALDNIDRDISHAIQVGGNLDVKTVGDYTLTYTVSDNVGNAAIPVTRSVKVQDTVAPTITPPVSILVAATNGSGTAATDAKITAFLSDATANDKGDGVIAKISHNAPAVFPLGTTTVTFTAKDRSGNQGTATATVTVQDQTAPILTLKGNAVINLTVGDNYTDAGATAADNVDDDVDITSRIQVTGSVNTGVAGSYTLTYSVSDNAANAAQPITRTVNVQGNGTPPVVTPPSPITVAAINAQGTPANDSAINSFLTSAIAIDNTGEPTFNITTNAPSQFPLGITTVTFTATDSKGNVGTGTSSVTVKDLTPPQITLNGDLQVTLNTSQNYVEAGATAQDNVDGNVTSAIVITGTVEKQPGQYTLSYQVTDNAGNRSASIQRVVLVQSDSAPNVTPPADITVAAVDSSGTSATDPQIQVFLGSAAMTDDIDTNLTVNHDAPSQFPLGSTQVTFSATDSSGNTGTATATVTIVDMTPPVLTLLGQSTITIKVNEAFADPGVSALDNVDGDISSAVVTSGVVDNTTPGTYTLNYDISDSAANAAATVSRTVIVQDSAAPTVSPPGDITVAAVDSLGTPANDSVISGFIAAASAQDHNGQPLIGISNDAPAVFPLGVTTVTFNVTDSDGKSGKASATVTVKDLTPPVLTLIGPSEIDFIVGDLYGELGASAIDNVDGVLSAQVTIEGKVDTSEIRVIILTYRVKDAAGNEAVALTRTITVKEKQLTELTFTDPEFRKCVTDHASENNWTNVRQVARLDCPGRNISSLYGINALTSLVALDLENNRVDNLRPLSNLRNARNTQVVWQSHR